ncbi:MAG: hypothetical protein ACT4P3_07130 [Betaproteobacteria bacterium]
MRYLLRAGHEEERIAAGELRRPTDVCLVGYRQNQDTAHYGSIAIAQDKAHGAGLRYLNLRGFVTSEGGELIMAPAAEPRRRAFQPSATMRRAASASISAAA